MMWGLGYGGGGAAGLAGALFMLASGAGHHGGVFLVRFLARQAGRWAARTPLWRS